jgi:hypothetical protein
MTKGQVKEMVFGLVRDHYAFEEYEMDVFFMDRKLYELAIDSIGMVEFFLILEDGLNLSDKLSSKVDMEGAMDKTVGEFMDVIVNEVWKIMRP